jgi:C-terminal processing protease CtpA/Prc
LSCAAAEQAASRPATGPTTRLTPQHTAKLVEQLGSRRWVDRDLATATLKRAGTMDSIDALAQAYKQHKSPEVRLRIKEVVEHVVLRTEMHQKSGFLGIRQRLVTRGDQLEVGREQAGIMIVEVLPGTAADQAGLNERDVIVGLNDERFKAPLNLSDFPKQISRMPPGTNVVLSVLRNGTKIKIRAKLGARPLEYANEQSVEFTEAQKKFAELWLARFDPDDKNVGVRAPALDRARPAIRILRDLEHVGEE